MHSGHAAAIIRQVEARGFAVSVFDLPTSLLETVPSAVEMHAVNTSTSEQHIARVAGVADPDRDYRCAVLLAEMVGVEVTDG